MIGEACPRRESRDRKAADDNEPQHGFPDEEYSPPVTHIRAIFAKHGFAKQTRAFRLLSGQRPLYRAAKVDIRDEARYVAAGASTGPDFEDLHAGGRAFARAQNRQMGDLGAPGHAELSVEGDVICRGAKGWHALHVGIRGGRFGPLQASSLGTIRLGECRDYASDATGVRDPRGWDATEQVARDKSAVFSVDSHHLVLAAKVADEPVDSRLARPHKEGVENVVGRHEWNIGVLGRGILPVRVFGLADPAVVDVIQEDLLGESKTQLVNPPRDGLIRLHHRTHGHHVVARPEFFRVALNRVDMERPFMERNHLRVGNVIRQHLVDFVIARRIP
mmetsp:Transcript_23202/g.61514  ORF Transcript_23202/g.61514 Transcript_23202/m.61514 type:complete len:333 (-) Transcript_23202:59-1057(-)